ncbi:hypothetical protein BHE74_00023236 [Ensete ventricosum]|nr:hypothetical protein BHE74_00023236 [Ensete ventricosum]
MSSFPFYCCWGASQNDAAMVLQVLLVFGLKLELVIMEMAQEIQNRTTIIGGAPVRARGLLSTEWEPVRMCSDSEFGLGGRLLEWWSPGEEGVL